MRSGGNAEGETFVWNPRFRDSCEMMCCRRDVAAPDCSASATVASRVMQTRFRSMILQLGSRPPRNCVVCDFGSFVGWDILY
jgi:hypothetical protein